MSCCTCSHRIISSIGTTLKSGIKEVQAIAFNSSNMMAVIRFLLVSYCRLNSIFICQLRMPSQMGERPVVCYGERQ